MMKNIAGALLVGLTVLTFNISASVKGSAVKEGSG